MATAIVIVGLVAVAQLVPASVMLNSNNRNDGTALVFAQREMEAMREQPLTATTFTDPLGVLCPSGQAMPVGRPDQPESVVGSPVVTFPEFSDHRFHCGARGGLQLHLYRPNDPAGTTTDVRWAVIMNTNPARRGHLATHHPRCFSARHAFAYLSGHSRRNGGKVE